ncbi:DMT family transporter [Staphylococcus felis]|uniref:DMT family transporter n=1 Tax=Staphylococcus felis TaxID=46127 RepID=UPI000E2715D0|nr:DMT family transporter [Staphylococcus felis]REH85801.1 EamA-like transporter family protein [Staphylococcus felis]REH92181.1 EamA-like transporter family protein [Staphylococcus felis]
MLLLLLGLGLCAGFAVPIQTAINSKLSLYTRSPFYAATISFGTGTIGLLLINIVFNPQLFNVIFSSQIQYTWFLGGMMGVIFLSGNLLLLPRIGASLTVVTTVSGQIAMSVVIDTLGLFNVSYQPFSTLKGIGLLLLLLGVVLMNLNRQSLLDKQRSSRTTFWLCIGVILGCAPPIQTAINTQLSQSIHSPLFASFISFLVGTLVLIIITSIIHRKFRIYVYHDIHGSIRWWHFIGGMLGVIFVTANIILTPHLGVAYTIIIVMIGQIIMGLIIDHFGLLGLPSIKISHQRLLGFALIIIAIIMIQLS